MGFSHRSSSLPSSKSMIPLQRNSVPMQSPPLLENCPSVHVEKVNICDSSSFCHLCLPRGWRGLDADVSKKLVLYDTEFNFQCPFSCLRVHLVLSQWYSLLFTRIKKFLSHSFRRPNNKNYVNFGIRQTVHVKTSSQLLNEKVPLLCRTVQLLNWTSSLS